MDKKQNPRSVPKSLVSRSAIYRIGVIHKEISMGSYPNAEDLGEILEVSYKTILRDIALMRNQFDFPIEYDHAKRGFYYNLTDEQSLDILYWQSIFSRIAVEPESQDALAETPESSAMNIFMHEMDSKRRLILMALAKIILLGGCIYAKKGASLKSATPLYLFKKRNAWNIVMTLDFGTVFIGADIAKCSFDKNSHITINLSETEPVANPAMRFNGTCKFPKDAEVCICAKDGIMRSCSCIKNSRLFFVAEKIRK